MKEPMRRILCACIICVFVNFVFANTVFMHAHLLRDGSTVTHSHPMLPASSHTHTADAISLIAQCNLAAASMESAQAVPVVAASGHWELVFTVASAAEADPGVVAASLRGPPLEG